MKYQKRPIVVEAEQYTDPVCPVKGMCIGLMCPTVPHVHTIHNNQFTPVELGDFIIPEPDGQHYYPCKADIFMDIYTSVDSEPKADDIDALSDAIDEQLEAKIKERRENCACPLCGDSEYHEEGCEIGQLQAIITDLLNHLPDSGFEGRGDESWDWCWNELSSEAQDAVKEVRARALCSI